jgi:hypothetical protein
MKILNSFIEIYNSVLIIPEIHIFGHIIGLIGMACIVVAYYLLERGRINHQDSKYYILNLIGALLLEISLIINFNLGSFIIEIFWVAISVNGLIRLRNKKAVSANLNI